MVKVIQQTAGSLKFICQALPAGHPFLASLYRLMRHENKDKVKTVPFLARVETFSDSIKLYTDVAGSPELGMGCTFGVDWCQGM